MSSEDLTAGSQWLEGLIRQTEGFDAAVLCLTPENARSPWILFEAGALMKSTAEGRVIPFTLFSQPSDLGHPLAFFQGYPVDRDGARRLFASLARFVGAPDLSVQESPAFAAWYTNFETVLTDIPRNVPAEDFLRLVKASDFNHPELFAEFSAQESQSLLSRLDQLADGFIQLFSSEVERFELELFGYLKRASLEYIDAVDLTTKPDLLLERSKRRLARKDFVRNGGRIRRILVVELQALTKLKFLRAVCSVLQQERSDGTGIGLLFRNHLSAQQMQDFILYADFATLVEQVQADKSYLGGSSHLLFKKRDVQRYRQVFSQLWPEPGQSGGLSPVPLRLASSLLQLDEDIEQGKCLASDLKKLLHHLAKEHALQ